MHSILLSLLLLAGADAAPANPEPLSFREFFEPKARNLTPTARLLSLSGKRVRIAGFMAEMELPPKGGFYLCPSPLFAAEGGGGTADLPPSAVFVVVGSAAGQELETLKRPVEVTGILEVGPETDPEGRVTRIRIVLDRPTQAEEVNR